METFGIQIQILKVLTILVLFYATLRKGEDRTGAITAVVMLTVFSIVIRGMNSGVYGIILAFTGILAAMLCTVFNYNERRISSGEFMISAALGAMVGPAGAVILFLIVMSLSLTQRIMGAGTTSLRDRYAGYLLDPSPVYSGEEYKSPLARIEASKMFSAPEKDAGDAGQESIADYARGTMSGIPTLPWGAKLAIAAMAVIFSGFFI